MSAIKVYKYLFVFTALLLAYPSYAAQAKITWTNTAQYSDIQPSTGTKKSTLAGLQKAIDSTFVDMARQLPEGYSFTAEITNVDLAGQVNPPQLIRPGLMTTRVLTNNYFPAITLSYTLTDAKGKIVLDENNYIIKDLDYLSNNTSVSSSTPFFYEVIMVRNWFHKAVLPAIN